MFLSYLKDRCKEDVMDLAIHVTLANKVLENNEKDSLKQYFHELGIEERALVPRYTVPEAIENVCKTSSGMERSMILFELIALACVDGECDEDESLLLKKIAMAFSIHEGKIKEMKKLIKKQRELYREIAQILRKED